MSEQAVILHVRPDSAADGGVSQPLSDRTNRPVRTASSPAEALEVLAATGVAAAVCDHAPEDGLDGLAVLDAIRGDYPELPVLLCTHEPDGRVAAEATRLDVTEYVPRSEVEPADRVRELVREDSGRALAGTRERELERNNEYLQRLTTLASVEPHTDDEIIERVLELGADRLDLSLGYLSRIEGSNYEVVSVVGDHDVIEAGTTTELANTYCRRIADGPDSFGVTDAVAEGLEDDAAYQMSGLACYLGGKVVVNGELYGTLCFADEEPRSEPFSESEQTFTKLLAEWTSRELERRQRSATLEQYENVIEAVDDGIYALDETGHFELVNDAMTELTGYSESALLGAHTSHIKSDEVVQRAESIVREMIFDEREGDEETFDLAIQRADGSAFPAEDHMTLLWDDDGEWFEGTAGIIRDITAQKERDQRLSGLLDTTRSLMQAHTAEAVAETVVAAAESELGFDLNLVRLYDEETDTLDPVAGTNRMPDRPVYDADEAYPGEAYQRGETVRVEDFADVENYDDRDANAAMYVPLDDHGVLSVATYDQEQFSDADVSVAEILASNAAAALDRVEREQDLLRYETVMENVRDMVYVLDDDGQFQLVTEPLADWLGYERTDLYGRHPRAVLDDESVAAFARQIRELRETDGGGTVRMETTLYTADGEGRPVEIEVSLIDEAGFRGTAGVVRDRTELEQTREELRDERDRFSYLFNNLPDAVVETEFTEDTPLVRSVNPAFTEVFGLDRRTVLDGDLNEYILPPSDDAHREADRLDERGADGETVQAEIRRRTADGFRDFLFRGVPYRRDDGRVWSFGIYTDITDQKERERRLEVLNRVLRHNLRNDLTVVLGLADELYERTDDETFRSLLERLLGKAEQIASLSDRAREIERSVRRDDADTAPLDVTELVDGVATRYAQQYDASVDISVPEMAVMAGDGRLEQVVGELLENSVEHAGEAPAVSVDVDPSPETVSVTVTDDGPGIPDHELDVLTGSEPITQLSHGSGLGLWLVIWVTESYGGTVRFENTADGASVTLTLPRTDS
ncbi:PAS domain S-box protein [Haloarcula salinisoli]|uniref:histidine kinase n=1 Tax=Haloarcula salinisoli TaxID=2487746 RepID=A0A8J8CDZ3_9EURY|nr:PAS domain S-box protein [Halomicroarcula salinisoli]MBX0305125.1 PAS domain S-box protein [Halomicroarcula salinisoli]